MLDGFVEGYERPIEPDPCLLLAFTACRLIQATKESAPSSPSCRCCIWYLALVHHANSTACSKGPHAHSTIPFPHPIQAHYRSHPGACGACRQTRPASQRPRNGRARSPPRIDHVYGITSIPSRPKRIVTVGWAAPDNILALGVESCRSASRRTPSARP